MSSLIVQEKIDEAIRELNDLKTSMVTMEETHHSVNPNSKVPFDFYDSKITKIISEIITKTKEVKNECIEETKFLIPNNNSNDKIGQIITSKEELLQKYHKTYRIGDSDIFVTEKIFSKIDKRIYQTNIEIDAAKDNIFIFSKKIDQIENESDELALEQEKFDKLMTKINVELNEEIERKSIKMDSCEKKEDIAKIEDELFALRMSKKKEIRDLLADPKTS